MPAGPLRPPRIPSSLSRQIRRTGYRYIVQGFLGLIQSLTTHNVHTTFRNLTKNLVLYWNVNSKSLSVN